MDEALVARLLATVALTNLVGDAITNVQRPEVDDLPGLTYQEVSPGLGGPQGMYNHGGKNDWQSPRIQFDAWASTPLEAKLVAKALIEELEAKPVAPIAGVEFDEALLDSRTDEPPERLEGGTDIFRVMVVMLVPWKAA